MRVSAIHSLKTKADTPLTNAQLDLAMRDFSILTEVIVTAFNKMHPELVLKYEATHEQDFNHDL